MLLDRKTAESERFEFSVNCQIMQIYNEKIYDLLQVMIVSYTYLPSYKYLPMALTFLTTLE